MRAVIVMFDSLNRHMLSPYADTFVDAPNFARLAAKAVTFENFYAGSTTTAASATARCSASTAGTSTSPTAGTSTCGRRPTRRTRRWRSTR